MHGYGILTQKKSIFQGQFYQGKKHGILKKIANGKETFVHMNQDDQEGELKKKGIDFDQIEKETH